MALSLKSALTLRTGAANVDFNERLDGAMNTNCRGPKRMLQLAQQCPNLLAYVHVSTAYVNCNLPSGTRVPEQLPNVAFDGDDMLAEIARLPVEAIVERTPAWLGKYPNTYTFTKALGEWLLHKHRGQVAAPSRTPMAHYIRARACVRVHVHVHVPRTRRRMGECFNRTLPAGSPAVRRLAAGRRPYAGPDSRTEGVTGCEGRAPLRPPFTAHSVYTLIRRQAALSRAGASAALGPPARPADRLAGPSQVPVAIVRPTIIGSAWREPEPGSHTHTHRTHTHTEHTHTRTHTHTHTHTPTHL